MMPLLALRNFLYKPWRSLLLFLGFGLGVSVMIVLLSIGEAMVDQAQDERLVGGGDVTVLPEGIDIEVMKTGGLGGLFFSITNARFLYRQLLGAPRLARDVRAVAPQDDDALLYLTTRDGVERTVRASGDIPSAQRAVRAAPVVLAGAWNDDSADRRWVAPTALELANDIDHFHAMPVSGAGRETWAEWHYFNVVSPDRNRWAFITFIVAGAGGRVLVTTHETGRPARRFVALVPPADVHFSATRADVSLGSSSVRVRPDGRYAVHATAREEGGRGHLSVDLVVTPAPGAYFPGVDLTSGNFRSGYTVPGLIADASGSLCIDDRCQHYEHTQSYHDHNWGVWRGVSWEWGATRAGAFGLLYGRVHAPDSLDASAPMFLYLVDSLGFRTVFRPRQIVYDDSKVIAVDGRSLRVPAHATLTDVRGADTLRLDLEIEDAVATRTPTAGPAHPYFVQMKGRAHLSGRAGGAALAGDGTGFFETYR